MALFIGVCILDGMLIFLVQDRWAIARLLVTLLLMVFTLQGRRWAKWMLIIMFGGLAAVLVAVVVGLRSQLAPGLVIGSTVMAVLYIVIPIYMGTNSDLNRYLAWKRQQSG
jgi:hypothetical protein